MCAGRGEGVRVNVRVALSLGPGPMAVREVDNSAQTAHTPMRNSNPGMSETRIRRLRKDTGGERR